MSQVNSVSSVQPNNYRRPDYKGALLTAGVGGAAWGVGEYIFKKSPFLDDQANLSDSFIRSVRDGLENLKDKDLLELNKKLEVFNSKIDKCTTAEALENLFRNNKKDLVGKTDDYLTTVSNYIKNETDLNKSKDSLKFIFENHGKKKKYVQEVYEACCDKAGKLVHDVQKVSKEKFDIVKNTANKFRKNNALGAAVSCAVISAAIMCIFEYFKGRKAKKMAQQEMQQKMQQPTIQKA